VQADCMLRCFDDLSQLFAARIMQDRPTLREAA
jgi:hypothetical protein